MNPIKRKNLNIIIQCEIIVEKFNKKNLRKTMTQKFNDCKKKFARKWKCRKMMVAHFVLKFMKKCCIIEKNKFALKSKTCVKIQILQINKRAENF